MDGPRGMLRRAVENRRAAAARQAALDVPEVPQVPARREAAQSHHATYSALMRSHDRMRTQHLPVQGGGGGA